MTVVRISIIAALARNRVIGRENALPWRIPADLRRFKQLTIGHTLLMGRKTYESIGRALPGRRSVVITRNASLVAPNQLVARSVPEALRMAEGDEVFIAGGAEIYRQTLELADRMYLTKVERDFEGDAIFPEWDEREWHVVADEAGGDEPVPYRFVTLDRRTPASDA
jgi:dihydrofolate reductase